MRIKFWPKNKWGKTAIVIAVVIFLPYMYSRALSPWRSITQYTIEVGEHKAASSSGQIRIACYNIAHGRGPIDSNSEGGNRQERKERLDKIAALLRRVNADVVVLNEVDFDTSWSYSVNQAEYLAVESGYAYRVEQRNLDFRILFWKWRFGNAVLSKYPITKSEVIDLPGYSTVETALAGKKRGIFCEIQAGKRKFNVIAAHLSHRSEDVRVTSAKLINMLVGKSDQLTIVAGDLNSTPSESPGSLKSGRGENAVEIFDRSAFYNRFSKIAPLQAGDLTYSSTKPITVIDWILIPLSWDFTNYKVVESNLSDHRPVYADAKPSKFLLENEKEY